jgi:hypothetical protein
MTATTQRSLSMSLASCLLALVLASSSLGGCDTESEVTTCIDWDKPEACPASETVAKELGAARVNNPGTLWPPHEYLINGVLTTVPAACCYEVTFIVRTRELH